MNPIVFSTSFQNATFKDWQLEFSCLYTSHDAFRSYQAMWLKVVEDACQVGEGIRKCSYSYALDRLGHTYCWILSFMNRIFDYNDASNEIFQNKKFLSIDDVLWFKYPGVCYRCLGSSCTCGYFNTEEKIKNWQRSEDPREEQLIAFRTQLNGRPHNLAEWEDLFERIYGISHTRQTTNEIAFHFLEEIGEVSRALRNLMEFPFGKEKTDILPNNLLLAKLQENFYLEISDSLSWLFSLVSKISKELQLSIDTINEYNKTLASPPNMSSNSNLLIMRFPITMASTAWKVYKSERLEYICCPTCGGRPCSCNRSNV